jgi:hypothetical protein
VIFSHNGTFSRTYREKLLKQFWVHQRVKLYLFIAAGKYSTKLGWMWMGVPLSIICSEFPIEMDEPHFFVSAAKTVFNNLKVLSSEN